MPSLDDHALLLRRALPAALARMERCAMGAERPLHLPWKALNTAFDGGWGPGAYFVMGQTGVGKSTFTLQIAAHALSQGVPTLLVATELN